jgi:hypothetical protein
MKQINRARYEVTNGEMVTVKLVATGVGDTAVFTTAPVAAQQIAPSPVRISLQLREIQETGFLEKLRATLRRPTTEQVFTP